MVEKQIKEEIERLENIHARLTEQLGMNLPCDTYGEKSGNDGKRADCSGNDGKRADCSAKDDFGVLKCCKSHGSYQYRIDGKYIPKKGIGEAERIAQRKYDIRLLKYIESNLKSLKETYHYFSECDIDHVYETMCAGRKELVKPAAEPVRKRIYDFMNEKYGPGIFSEYDESEIYSVNRERVRSKSEKLIADELARREIPYRYERPIQLKDGNKLITFRPDFTVMNKRNGRIYFMEHLGMMGSDDYYNRYMNKLDIYERNGYIIGREIILVHETSGRPLNTMVLNSYIEEYLL